MTEEDIIDDILRREAWPTFTDAKNDRGGPTKGGITLATLSMHRGARASIEDLKNLGGDEARAIYRRTFILLPRFDKIRHDELRAHVIDAGVLHGVGHATLWLQAIAGVKTDGVFGPVSQSAVNALSPRAVGVQFAALRIQFIGALISKNYQARARGKTDQDQSEWAGGWLNRATSFLQQLC